MPDPTYVPPAHQTATFDQAYAGISASIDELIAAYRNARAQNAATREIDIAGLVGFLLETPNTREEFAEGFAVAIVRLAEHERQVREQAAREIHDQAANYADTQTGPRASFRRGMLAAAQHIAPTPTPQEIADAINRGEAVFCNPPEENE